jgi:hypothetical protein
MVIGGHFKLNYHKLLMDIDRYSIGDYFMLNYHILLVIINGYYISG